MRSTADSVRPSPDWLTLAQQMDDGVSPSSPVYGALNETQSPQPMRVDMHPAVEVGVVLSGHQVRYLEDMVFHLGEGDVWLCAAWEPHGWEITSNGGCLLVFTALPEVLVGEPTENVPWLEMFAAPPRERPQVVGAEGRCQVLAIAGEIEREVRQRPAYWLTAVRLGMLRLLLSLARSWNSPAGLSPRPRPAANDLARIMPALMLVRPNPQRPVTLSQAAAACGLSVQRFGVIFRNVMGTSFARFRIRARLVTAAHLLLTSGLSVAAIATQTGFLDASHLHRTFVKYYACTPAAYRQRAVAARAAVR